MNKISCKICGYESNILINHLQEKHHLTVDDYQKQFPGAPIMDDLIIGEFNKKKIKRQYPKPVDQLTIEFGKINFNVNWDVPEDACLPFPDHYMTPEYGKLGADIQHTLTSLKFHRSQYIWGMPGSGKDALFHAWSALTRTPAIIRQVKPGTDIESWFFTRAFNETGTYWEEGAVLKALRDGYTTQTGRKIPYMFLITDFDRADREQGEHLRLITDSIQGRIDGPAGKTYKVFPGTYIVATANTAGSGDDRGRMISANPLDASLLDRFERKFQFHWMDWKDEEVILKEKFPILAKKAPSIFTKLGSATKNIRMAILNDELYGEFSHRGCCAILGHAQDIIETKNKIPKTILKLAARSWLDGLPDQENRDAAKKIMDSHFTMLDEGDINHIDMKNKLEF